MLPTFSLVQDNLRASMEALELLRQNADYVSSKLEVKTGLKRKLAAVKIAIGKESSDRLISRLNESVTLLGLALTAWNIHDAKLNKIYTPSKFGRFAMAYATTTVYNVVSSESDIIQRIREGDRAGVRELFGTRKASPFDKDEFGHSLLYHAANSKNFDICQLLLSLGLHEALLEKAHRAGESPLAPPVFNPNRSHPEKTWLKIAGLFQSYMDEPETSMVLRMFDYHRECDYGDDCIQKWVSILQESGVDLMLYGEQESINISKYFRAAFDSDAIEASRNEIRNVLPSSSAELTFRRAERSDRKMWNNNHWIPIRLLELKFGPTPSEWEIVWVPEFEWMANEFWQMMEKETIIMPGSWIDE
ncbi:hypothetical protein FOC1_g10016225 [Fusarium oxysporum f. sp. cubense race 1]|uniref:Ankyrin repeat protein n=1 Tax=Fusarium oxysporum f. sp. cubense (strain race 1) TaxID=1229664 RepID=N4TUV5_FUSC1|nr:hypothetical protein FOC1_g10016225 [Fusarium oxysporum f. sp. cubense race 1]